MKWTVSKKFNFEAAHSLPFLPIGHKCRNVHGHSYVFEVFIETENLDDRGFVVDYADISKIVNPIVEKLDHKNLNELFEFKTTAENLAKWIHDEINKSIPVCKIKFYETAKTCVKYQSGKGPQNE